MTGLVHVGIVTYNSAADLPACFAGLAAQTYPHIAVTVLDNCSQDESAAWVRLNAPHARLIVNAENAGFARAHNHILAQRPDAAYYMALNPDVRLQPGYIAGVIEALDSTGAGWGTGKLLLDEGGQLYSVGHGLRRDGYALNIGYGLPDDGRFDNPREVFGAPGAAAVYTRALIEHVAPEGELFDAHMFMYAEDSDLDWRARRLGWRCWYTPAALAYHRGSQARGRLQVQAIGNRYLSVSKNAYLYDLLTYNLPLITLHCLLRLVFSPALGLRLINQLVQLILVMWRKRRTPVISRAALHQWFRWSSQQPTAQPVGWQARFAAFLRR